MSLENKIASPLVSIVVIVYNSEKYIIETLESIKDQTYQDLELIIADDCSTDATVEVCDSWIKGNSQRFSNVKIVKNETNSGIAKNCNLGVAHSSGEWVKLCAGDDLLMPNCIADNINFIQNECKDAKIVISDSVTFLDETFPRKTLETTKPYWGKRNLPATAKEQYDALLLSYCGNTTSLFINKEVFKVVKYDEDFPFLEDYPFLLNATKNGFYVHYFDKETVLFRQRKESVYAGDNNRLFKDYYKKSRKFDQKYRYPNLPIVVKLYEKHNYYRLLILDSLKLNQKTTVDKFVFAVTRYLNPFRYIIYANDFLYKLKNN